MTYTCSSNPPRTAQRALLMAARLGLCPSLSSACVFPWLSRVVPWWPLQLRPAVLSAATEPLVSPGPRTEWQGWPQTRCVQEAGVLCSVLPPAAPATGVSWLVPATLWGPRRGERSVEGGGRRTEGERISKEKLGPVTVSSGSGSGHSRTEVTLRFAVSSKEEAYGHAVLCVSASKKTYLHAREQLCILRS